MDLAHLFTPEALAAFGQVVLIDVVLAGDNAIVVGALAAGLPAQQRKQVILIGIIAALVLRIGFALAVTQLLQIVGLILAGGLLLLWVAWRMWREINPRSALIDAPGSDADDFVATDAPPAAKSFAAAAWSVAGAAREHPDILIAGLVLSVALMGIAANIIAQYIERYRWIAYVGLAVIVYVAFKMIYEGFHEVAPIVQPMVGM